MKKKFNPKEWMNNATSIQAPQSSKLEEVEEAIQKIESNQVDIAPTYDDWLKIGFAFADEFGESGRSLFHRASSFYSGYTQSECDLQFDNCLKSKGNGINLCTFFHYAKQAQIVVSSKPDYSTDLTLKDRSTRDKYKIDVTEHVPPPKVAWALKNTKDDGEAILGTLGDFGLLIGKAKSRKSFFVSIAVAAAIGDDLVLGRFSNQLPSDKKHVAYFDTEQSKYYVQKAVKRICTQVEQPEPKNLHAYHLRSLNPSERLKFIENEIYSNDSVGFVVIDGIKDLVTSINSEEEATMIASKLLKWSEEREIFILVVLHQNKGDNNARGHIGTELINKAHTVLSVTKAEEDKDISIVEAQQCRDKEPETFAFEIDEYGIPVIAENFELRTENKKSKFDITDLEEHKKYKILTEVFSQNDQYSYGELTRQIQFAYKNQYSKKLGDNRAKDLISYCKNQKWLLQEKEKAPYTLGNYGLSENVDCGF